MEVSSFIQRIRFTSVGNDYHLGSFGPNIQCKFIIADNPSSIRKCREIWLESSSCRAKYLLVPHLVSQCHIKGEEATAIAFAFSFDMSFHEFPQKPLFPGAMMKAFWRVNIRGVLLTMVEMHGNAVFHGQLDQERSYKMVNEKVYLVKTNHVPNANERDDLRGFRNFLLAQHPDDQINVDWTHFLASFDHFTAQELLKHPVLLDGEEICHYVMSITDHQNHNLTEEQSEDFENELNKLPFNMWFLNIADHDILAEVFNDDREGQMYTRRGRRKDRDGTDLLSYMRKVVENYSEKNMERNRENQKTVRKDKLRSTIIEVTSPLKKVGELLSKRFPGFLSEVHGILVRLFRRTSNVSRRALP